MLNYRLGHDNNLMCDKVCRDISHYLQKYKKDNPTAQDLMLVIEVKQVTESGSSLLPKLEYKNE
jgi:hypothetical protein